ncbi:MAG TPA: hypothetical protein VFD36_05270 [Kofleriaceae bacterium]|nr:hypothetical protein [Kofleriaceae bacterium]
MTGRWVVMIALVGFVAEAQAQVMSPGALAQAHASIDSDDDCGRCHESGKRVVARLCLECHKDLGAELAASRGLHGKQYKGKPCEECHVDHLGRGSKLVRWPGGAMEKLDHGLTGWSLDGGHAKSRCIDCHKKTSPLGKVQFLGTSAACGSCHTDPHRNRFGGDCAKCHGVSDWKRFDRKTFDHALARFTLTGKHATVACESCHTGSPPKWKPLEFSTCESCHADPHRGQFKSRSCTACHDTASWNVAADTVRQTHPRLSLANGHGRVACASCHDQGNNKPPSKGSRCESCHRPVHIAKFGPRCESCHASIKWVGLPEAIGRDNHAATRYPLAGKHAGVECAGCHLRSKPQAARFRNLAFTECASCHSDKHDGAFKKRDGGDCRQCHTVAGFVPTTFGVKAHDSAFPLTGKHIATPCGRCHVGPRPRLRFVVGKTQCADCHADPHGAQFANEMARGGCAACHTTIDWRQSKISHSTWPLLGVHATTKCAACHGAQRKGAEPAAYRGIPRDCEGCHDDVHAGQFRQSQPDRACKSCHDPTKFSIASAFDHRTTGYPLDGRHAPLACNSCHAPVTLRDGSTAIRWRLGYRRCKDCHANPHQEGP